jgi:hypothetical protein
MKISISCDNELNQNRFMTSLYILRLGGISLNIKSPSNVNTIYNVVCVVCLFISAFCVIMDIFAHIRDLVHAMQKLRIILGMSLVVWIRFSLRYVTL